MSRQLVQELIQVEIAKLPENLAREVFDFILYLRDRQSEETFCGNRPKQRRLINALILKI